MAGNGERNINETHLNLKDATNKLVYQGGLPKETVEMLQNDEIRELAGRIYCDVKPFDDKELLSRDRRFPEQVLEDANLCIINHFVENNFNHLSDKVKIELTCRAKQNFYAENQQGNGIKGWLQISKIQNIENRLMAEDNIRYLSDISGMREKEIALLGDEGVQNYCNKIHNDISRLGCTINEMKVEIDEIVYDKNQKEPTTVFNQYLNDMNFEINKDNDGFYLVDKDNNDNELKNIRFDKAEDVAKYLGNYNEALYFQDIKDEWTGLEVSKLLPEPKNNADLLKIAELSHYLYADSKLTDFLNRHEQDFKIINMLENNLENVNLAKSAKIIEQDLSESVNKKDISIIANKIDVALDITAEQTVEFIKRAINAENSIDLDYDKIIDKGNKAPDIQATFSPKGINLTAEIGGEKRTISLTDNEKKSITEATNKLLMEDGKTIEDVVNKYKDKSITKNDFERK